MKLAHDQAVVVALDTLPNVELKDTISSIVQTYTENQGDVVDEVSILLTVTDPNMRWGMIAEVKFKL